MRGQKQQREGIAGRWKGGREGSTAGTQIKHSLLHLQAHDNQILARRDPWIALTSSFVSPSPSIMDDFVKSFGFTCIAHQRIFCWPCLSPSLHAQARELIACSWPACPEQTRSTSVRVLRREESRNHDAQACIKDHDYEGNSDRKKRGNCRAWQGLTTGCKRSTVSILCAYTSKPEQVVTACQTLSLTRLGT